jgi:hypothetical protein
MQRLVLLNTIRSCPVFVHHDLQDIRAYASPADHDDSDDGKFPVVLYFGTTSVL